ncbi:MAG: rane Transport [Rubritepida sp.]|nr:rane Transport [Rubritepida sp.]
MTGQPAHDGEAGAIAPLVALLLASFCGFAGLAVDMGLLQYQRRSLQASVDAAALSAARAPAQAQVIATSILARNGTVSGTPTIVAGNYADNPALAPAQRFLPGGVLNAVRVTARRDVQLGLTRVLGGPATTPVNATAVAAAQAVAGFNIGSGVASVNGGVLGQFLGLGSASITGVSYTGLAQANVRVLALGDALAAQLGLSAGTYQQLLNSQATIGQIMGVAASALAPASPAAAATSLNLLAQSTRTIRVGDLLGLAFHQTRQIGDFTADQSYMNLGVNALDLVTAAATLGGANAATLPVGLTVPGVATATTRVMAIEPPQGTAPGAIGMGPVGTRAQTAQVRALISLQLLPLPGSGGVINLPLLVEAAPAQAELRDVSCQGEPGTDTTLHIQATTGVARAQIGQITAAQFANAGQTFGTLAPVPIVTIQLVIPLVTTIDITVNLQALATVGTGSRDLTFTTNDIAARTAQTVSSGGLAGSLIGSLGSNLILTTSINLHGVSLSLVSALLDPVVTALLSSVVTALKPVLNSLDGTLDQVLAAAGVRVGFADVLATGTRCGISALVL